MSDDLELGLGATVTTDPGQAVFTCSCESLIRVGRWQGGGSRRAARAGGWWVRAAPAVQHCAGRPAGKPRACAHVTAERAPWPRHLLFTPAIPSSQLVEETQSAFEQRLHAMNLKTQASRALSGSLRAVAKTSGGGRAAGGLLGLRQALAQQEQAAAQQEERQRRERQRQLQEERRRQAEQAARAPAAEQQQQQADAPP